MDVRQTDAVGSRIVPACSLVFWLDHRFQKLDQLCKRPFALKRAVLLVLGLLWLPGQALAAIVIDSATLDPNPVAAGSTANITVNVTLSGGSDADWQSTNIALVKAGENPIQLFCGNSPNISNTNGAHQFAFNNLPIPNYIAGGWNVRVRSFDDDGECGDTSFGSGDTENNAAAVAQVTQPVVPGSVDLDLVLCLDGSTSLSQAEWDLQIAGTDAGLQTALASHLNSSVRLTAIVFATGVNRAVGPTVIDSQATLTAFRNSVSAIPRPTGSTNTAGCFSAAQAVLCNSGMCPDDGTRRVIDISTDGNPTVENCPGNQNSTQCAVLRRNEAEAAGIDALNVIGVGDGIGLSNMQSWAFPTPVQTYDTSLGQFPEEGDEGFVVLVDEFEDYGPAIAAKLEAEITGDFFVRKTYSDGNMTPISVMLSCTGATSIDSANPATATPGGPAAVFNLSGFDPNNDTCTAVEVSGLPGEYSKDESDCFQVPIQSDGDCTIVNTLSSASFTVSKDFVPDSGAMVSVSLSCSSGAPTMSPLMASEALPAMFTVEGFQPGATCTATETVPAGYSWTNPGDCTGVGLLSPGSCVLTNTLNTATFTVSKSYNDANSNAVQVSLVCGSGNVTVNNNMATPGGPDASFTVSGYLQGSLCTATEAEPVGYTWSNPNDCAGVALLSEGSSCNLHNIASDSDVDLVKTGNLVLGGDGTANPGDLINYSLTVTNSGNTVLTNVSVSDPLVSPIDCPSGNPIPSLAPGANEVCTGSYAITQADIDAGVRNNTATVNATDPFDDPVMDSDDHSESIPQNPAMTVAKAVTNTGTGPGNAFQAGDTVTYGITVSNGGNVTLTAIVINDPVAGLNNAPCSASLAPGGMCSVNTGSYLVTQNDIDTQGGGDGDIDNTAVASSDQAPDAQDSAEAPLVAQDQDIMLVKDGALDTGGDGANPGDLINYSFQVINTGNVTLTNVTVSDPLVSPISCPSGNPIPSLVAGASETCTGSYAVTQGDIDAGVRDNMATAEGTDPNGAPVMDSDDHSESIPQSASMLVGKTVTNAGTGAGGAFQAGDTVTYGIQVTNSGNVTLTGVVVNDPVAGIVNAACAASLDPGAMCSVDTGSYLVTQGDIDNDGGGDGDIDNTATAGSNEAPDAQDSAAAPLVSQGAGILMLKDGTPDFGGDGIATPGDLVSYTFEVSNTGNVTLSDVVVSDPLIATIACPGGNPVASLAPGESVTCSGNYALTQNDIDAGHVENTADAEGECQAPGCPVSDEDTEIVPILQVGGLDVEKSAEPQTYSLLGQVITYTFTVENTGNVTLSNVLVSDPLAGLSAIGCPGGNPIPTMSPGAVVICTATYEITQADLDAGSVNNSVSVIGDCPGMIQGEPGGGQENCPPEDQDEETIVRVAVDLAKTVQSGPTLEEDGTYTVIYLITATNLGGGQGLYDVIDQFMPGSGITLNTATAMYQAGTENAQTGTLGNFPVDDVIVTGEGLADGLNEFWVVDANFTVDPTKVDPECDPGEPMPGAEFYNSVAGPDPDPGNNDDCAGLPPDEIDLSKTVVSLVENGGGLFTVTYRITADNLGDGPGTYDLVDTLDPGMGVTVVSAQLTAYVPGAENNQSGMLAGPLPYSFTSGETLVTGEDLAGQSDESWTVVVQFEIDGSQVGGDYECAGPGTGTYNEVSGSETDPDPGNNSDCEDPPLARTTFVVTKDFSDDNPAGVTVRIECNTGLPLQQQGVVHDPDAAGLSPSDFTVIEFVVGDFEPGTMDCDIDEVVPAGYVPTYTAGATTGVANSIFESEDGCHYELITGGQFSCEIFNELQPVDVIVEKIWIDENPEFQQSTVVEVTLECDGPILGGFPCPDGEGAGGNSCRNQFIDPNNPGEFSVVPHFEGTFCAATEELLVGVVTDESDCEEMILFPGEGESCVIVNTRLYAGIPTLSRNGLILLSLLMLGIGALAYRRFA